MVCHEEATASSDRGRLFEATSWSPSLSKGITSANFHASGYLADSREEFIISVRDRTNDWGPKMSRDRTEVSQSQRLTSIPSLHVT